MHNTISSPSLQLAIQNGISCLVKAPAHGKLYGPLSPFSQAGYASVRPDPSLSFLYIISAEDQLSINHITHPETPL